MNPKVDFFFEKATLWQREYKALRAILLDCGLEEELKWGVPCYTIRKANVVLMHGFKEYCALLFHKGVLLKDPDNILIQQTPNVQSARQIRFTGIEQIKGREALLKTYVMEAIAVEKAGMKVPAKTTDEYPMPEEFERALAGSPELKTAFKALTPGRQRGYLMHFSQPKLARTRESRIEKATFRILQGKGLDDR